MRQFHKTMHSNEPHLPTTLQQYHHKAEPKLHTNQAAPVLVLRLTPTCSNATQKCEGDHFRIALPSHSIERVGSQELVEGSSPKVRDENYYTRSGLHARDPRSKQQALPRPKRKAKEGVNGRILGFATLWGVKSQDASGEVVGRGEWPRSIGIGSGSLCGHVRVRHRWSVGSASLRGFCEFSEFF